MEEGEREEERQGASQPWLAPVNRWPLGLAQGGRLGAAAPLAPPTDQEAGSFNSPSCLPAHLAQNGCQAYPRPLLKRGKPHSEKSYAYYFNE